MSQAQVVPADDDYQTKIDRCAANVVAFVKADVSLRVPRTEEKRRNAFAEWLEERRVQYRPVIQSELDREFAFPQQKPVGTVESEETFEAQAEEEVWRQVAPILLSYALRGQAAAWVSRHMGDATTIGWPEKEGNHWRIPIGVAKYGDNLGEIILDENGTVIPHLTSTREKILEKIRDRKLPVAETTARK